MKKTNGQIALQVSVHTIIGNCLLSIFKLAAGIFGKSGAMLSDAVHTMSDVFSTVVVMIGVRIANKESDKEHPYGHERLECVAAIILAVILCGTGLGIGYSGFLKVMAGNWADISVPGGLALVAAVVSIGAKEGMYWYTRAAAKKVDSGALMADAWHHRSDALSSVGSLIGIMGAQIGFPVLDPIASIIICIFIVKAAYKIFMDAIGKMTDQSCDDAFVMEMTAVILEQDGVLGIDQLKTRLFGDKIYVDIEISGAGEETLNKAHAIAQQVHDAVEGAFPAVKHCMVHVNPAQAEEGETDRQE